MDNKRACDRGQQGNTTVRALIFCLPHIFYLSFSKFLTGVFGSLPAFNSDKILNFVSLIFDMHGSESKSLDRNSDIPLDLYYAKWQVSIGHVFALEMET
jgi:hypothetical protein